MYNNVIFQVQVATYIQLEIKLQIVIIQQKLFDKIL